MGGGAKASREVLHKLPTRAETKRAEKKATQSGSRVEDLQRRSPLARQLLSFNLLALTIPTLGLLYLGDYGRSFSEIERDATSDTVEIIAATVAQRIQHDARVHSDEHETSEEIISEELLSRLISVAALHRSTLYVYVLDPYREVETQDAFTLSIHSRLRAAYMFGIPP